jgi:CPA2 family monovalent cation:H+ antiporter-2
MIEALITDLAYILILAAIVTLIFKRIKQPVVLGYIVAGFLASPNFTYLPSLAHSENIDFWAELGIVVLLFSLGLEFSFKKLLSTGGSAIVTALIIIIGMMLTGYCIGHMLGFTPINSIFLGGMLSMSSTTIILKALTDLGMRHRKFASQVFAVLIVEDLFAVLMMVILSSVALNNAVEGGEMLMSLAKLGFFLVIWFVVGIYVLPSLLNSVSKWLSDETLLVVAMALCLGMAVFSVHCGFSLALGAFVMGSILAGTRYAERIEHVVTPVKDLFGSVFFISVGMMVNPGVIAEFWRPILILSVVVIVGMIVFGTFGMLVTGQTLRVAIQSGFTLTQIGEFSFIIATLGMTLGVLESNIYPIVVAVSVITTFTTPYFIRMATPAYELLERHLPKKLSFLINRYSATAGTETVAHQLWRIVLRRYAWRVLLYSIILVAVCLICSGFVTPFITRLMPGWFGRFVACVLTLSFMSPFLLALCAPTMKRKERDQLLEENARFNMPMIVLFIFRLIIGMAFVAYVISVTYGWALGATTGAAVFVMGFVTFSRRVRHRLRRIETTFLNNLNDRELRRTGHNNNLVSDMHMAFVTVSHDCPFVGDRLSISNLGKKYGVNVASIQRGGNVIPVPGGNQRLFPGDVVGLIGTEERIQAVIPHIEASEESAAAQSAGATEEVKFSSITLSESSPLIGQTLASANVRNTYHALIVAIQRGEEFPPLSPNEKFHVGDTLWLVAQPSSAKKLS